MAVVGRPLGLGNSGQHSVTGPFRRIAAPKDDVPGNKPGETAANVWYRIHLTVRDSAGVEHSTFRDVFPRTVMLTLATNPSGLQVTLNGQPHTTPYTFESVVGIKHTISAPTPQTLGGDAYRFRSWSDGKSRTHPITAPAVDRIYLATFRPQ